MSINKESIQVIAQMLGMNKMRDDIAQAIASDAEYRVREIIQDSVKFMRHSKRKILSTEDVNHALTLKNIEPLYGFRSGGSVTSATTPGINTSISAAATNLGFRKVPHTRDLYFVEDIELDVNDCLQTPIPKVPVGPTISAHWLAIQGVQPRIPQNPIFPEDEELEAAAAAFAGAESKDENDEQARKRPRHGESGTGGTVVAVATADGGKHLVKHVLTAELQMYYEKVTAAIKGNKPLLRLATLDSLASDPGLHQLVPYLTAFIVNEVTNNLRDLNLLQHLMEVVKALLSNPNIHIELYLHQLIPSILTCIVGKRLCEDPARQNHWALRDFAASLIAQICHTYGSSYHTMQERITKTLFKAFMDPEKPRTTHYGAIVGLTALGPHVVQLYLLEPSRNSNLVMYANFLQRELADPAADHLKRQEALKCQSALLNAASTFFLRLAPLFKESTDAQLHRKAKSITAAQTESTSQASETLSTSTASASTVKQEETASDTTLLQVLRERMNALSIPDDIHLRYQELFDIFGESILPFIHYDIVPVDTTTVREPVAISEKPKIRNNKKILVTVPPNAYTPNPKTTAPRLAPSIASQLFL